MQVVLIKRRNYLSSLKGTRLAYNARSPPPLPPCMKFFTEYHVIIRTREVHIESFVTAEWKIIGRFVLLAGSSWTN